MFNIPAEHVPGLVLLLACGIAGISVLICAIVSLVRDHLNGRLRYERKRMAARCPLRVVRRY